MCYTDIATRVALLSQFAGEELVELSTEDTVSNELSLFRDLGGHCAEGLWSMLAMSRTKTRGCTAESRPEIAGGVLYSLFVSGLYLLNGR